MSGRRIFTASVLLAAPVLAQSTDYFPLQQGNVWIYRCTGACGDPFVTVEVGAPQDFGGNSYRRLQGWFGADYWVRQDGSGSFFALDSGAQQEHLWYAFQTAEGASYDESIPSGCCGRATIQSRSAHYSGPEGTFDNALQIDYPGVFQVGVFREIFLPWVGMLSRVQAAGGPAVRTYDLIYARIGGALVATEPEISVSLALDHAAYSASDSATLNARLSIRNSTAEPEVLTFPSGQLYDLEIRDEQGNVVYQWSRGKLFPQVITTLQLQFEKDYPIAAPLAGLPPGKYIVQAWLAVQGPPRAYSASSRIEIE